RHPDRLQALFGLRLEVFRQFVQYIGGLMHPTSLPMGLAVHVAERLPKPQRAIANGQGWPVLQAVLFEVEQEFFPGLLALPVAIPEADAVFLATGVSPNNHQQTMPRFLQPRLEVHAIDPDIDVAFAREVPLLPLRQFFLPPLLQAAQRRWG